MRTGCLWWAVGWLEEEMAWRGQKTHPTSWGRRRFCPGRAHHRSPCRCCCSWFPGPLTAATADRACCNSRASSPGCSKASTWGNPRKVANRSIKVRIERKLTRVPAPRALPREPNSLPQANITTDHRSQIIDPKRVYKVRMRHADRDVRCVLRNARGGVSDLFLFL